jgi:hypothetical protein
MAAEPQVQGAETGGEEEQQAVAGDVHTHGEPAAEVEVPDLMAGDVHGHEDLAADAGGDPAADAEVHQAVVSDVDTRAEQPAEEHTSGESAAEHDTRHDAHHGAYHAAEEAAPVEAREVPAPDEHDTGDEHRDEERVAAWMQAGPPDATMEESDVMVATHAAPDAGHDDATGASETLGANGAATAEQAGSMASAHAAVHPAVMEHVSSAGDARGMLEGVAQSLRTLAGRDANGQGIAIFPHGVDVLEVRMHISRDRDIDLNFRVAGPTVPGTSV